LLSRSYTLIYIFLATVISAHCRAQQQYDLNSDWKCIKASAIKEKGERISTPAYTIPGLMPAVVPGTVLTTLLSNKLIPDPFYGMNNERIPDIYNVGNSYYTYWFIKDFLASPPSADEKVWLQFWGINYSADIYLNGHKLNDKPDKGMYLRQSYDITPFMSKDQANRLAVIVYPPDPPGNPNGGQGGDGMIAHSVTAQYTAGWDWIQPVRDRNTGIWDKVSIKRTKQVHVENTHVITLVPGRRSPVGPQKQATLRVSMEVENPDSLQEFEGTAQYEVAGKKVFVKVKVAPLTSEFVAFPPLTIDSPRLWWPNGYGSQELYDLKARFFINGKTLADEEHVTFGIRELKAVWNKKTSSRELHVNGQKIFLKGGNRILSDALLRFSEERYDAEVRYHRDMNLNLIRVWGGGITERPEFYDACDKYGLLVMQDFWVSGDCNGRWYDPLKREDTNARRAYPDDHVLFLESLDDQVRMLRNHPSLAFWCGGNEIRPPADILIPFRDSILHELDSTRFFFEYSNDDSMSLQSGDGPYTIQRDNYFWEHRSFPFNSEIGSVGIGDDESLMRFLPLENLKPPYYDAATRKWVVDSVWRYHKFAGYDSVIEAYGHADNLHDFAQKAQLVNYNQYRALMESFSAHMWDWYTGVIIWKTQNPWTAMVGQMYDVYLDPNACLDGVREGAKPLHIMYDPVHRSVIVANNGFKSVSLRITSSLFDAKGIERNRRAIYNNVSATKAVAVPGFSNPLDSQARREGGFLYLSLADSASDSLLDENLYWLPDAKGSYTWLEKMETAKLRGRDIRFDSGIVELTLENPAGGPVAFFNHITLADPKTGDRLLPYFCDNNYISLLPGQRKRVRIEYEAGGRGDLEPIPTLEGWNANGFSVGR